MAKTMWTGSCPTCGTSVPRPAPAILKKGQGAFCSHPCWARWDGRKTHGHKAETSATYRCWRAMKQRCQNPAHAHFHQYGGRGVRVCKRWQSFENFLADLGLKPEGRTLDRIDVNGHYSPENCRWATWDTQCNNRRYHREVEYRGRVYRMQALCDHLGVTRCALDRRIEANWPQERWSEPLRQRLPHKSKSPSIHG